MNIVIILITLIVAKLWGLVKGNNRVAVGEVVWQIKGVWSGKGFRTFKAKTNAPKMSSNSKNNNEP